MKPDLAGEYNLLEWQASKVVENAIYTFAEEGRLHILDISNPISPKEIDLTTNVRINGESITVAEGIVYVGSWVDGLSIFSMEASE